MPVSNLRFVKMSGAGNDFVVADNRGGAIEEAEKPPLARRACRRKLGIGADGLILVERGGQRQDADYVMRYFNADGSEGELCGNGTRCAAVFAREIGAGGISQRIATPAGVLRADILASAAGAATVRVAMTKPSPIRRLRLSDLPGGEAELFALEVGVPHAIEVVPDVGAVDVDRRGSAIRRHEVFPAGANANFIALDEGSGEIRLRTFERGVEAECLACGTGATAAVTVAHRFLGWPAAVPVRVASGDLIHIDFTGEAPLMEGPVTRVFEGAFGLVSGSTVPRSERPERR
ncbi:MAG: diaminopimelate epimerase [Acidobacteria bacterium]|nr:diaminopimelate epimerase [Acidobacteriota bacterium]MXW38655.1 diaminopimelate epimerase [Acidobacteriota bacterium]MYA46005.1 diaminopimelate epimerase [Acidobacteriota bacterium]MYI38620.1 diaminopimelate epimerase [Acidobacteriota bacterium]MYK79156.1 diaminopimelate epimerase [Acidobacteriota bacterium]